jgi:hypothetical protein
MSRIYIKNKTKLNLQLWFNILDSLTPNDWGELEDETQSDNIMRKASIKFNKNKFN